MDPQLEWLEKQKAKYKNNDDRLVQTKKCIEMWREARGKGMKSEVVNELFLLITAMAKTEWGQETTVDDFSIPEKILIKNGPRSLEL